MFVILSKRIMTSINVIKKVYSKLVFIPLTTTVNHLYLSRLLILSVSKENLALFLSSLSTRTRGIG
jgi:hypothetical protein